MDDMSEIRQKRFRAEKEELEALGTRIVDTTARYTAALDAFEVARRAKDDLEEELASLRARFAGVQKEVLKLRKAFRRDFMDSFPAELLRDIFQEVTALPASLRSSVQNSPCFDKMLAIAPFRLAAVCKRWRRIALHHPQLWTYIASPPYDCPPFTEEGYTARAALIITRSKNCGLDIFLSWHNRPMGGSAATINLKLLAMVGEHAHRWRIFELWLPDDFCSKDHLLPLKGTLPLLERLCVIADNTFSDAKKTCTTQCLPYAPRLNEAVFWGPNSFTLNDAAVLPALRALRLHQLPYKQIWQLLPLVASTLEDLSITLNCSDSSGASPPSVISLPRLAAFALYIDDDGVVVPGLHKLRLPAVTALALSCSWIEEPLRPFFETIAPTVIRLTLTGPSALTTDQLTVLKALGNVAHLEFGAIAPEVTSEYAVPESVFACRDVWVHDPLWPKLASVVFGPDGKLELADDGDSILAFIRWRTIDVGCRSQGADSPGVRRLSHLRFDEAKTPKWLVEGVQSRLSIAPKVSKLSAGLRQANIGD
ncbi:hypothetical protein AURDEDRAFT_181796 [Auricularia subglabra TFB-10046 SS5]|nr:hypothetical protein AURDEDRAFT_181796 [Auricularia subglabra TFB-10046 SS5]